MKVIQGLIRLIKKTANDSEPYLGYLNKLVGK